MTCSCSQPFVKCSSSSSCLCWREIQMTKKSCSGRAACAPHQDQSKMRGEASQGTKHRESSSSGPNAPPKKKTWKKYLTFLSKFQNKMKHKKPDARAWAPSSFKQGIPKRSSRAMLEECVSMVRVIRRTAADCFASAVAGGDEDDELPCYMQLDQVSYGVKREAYGPLYLVT